MGTQLSEILIVSDVAARLKLTERSVNAMLADRELPGFRVRSQWRLRSDQFERWLNLVGAGRTAKQATALISTEAASVAAAASSHPRSGSQDGQTPSISDTFAVTATTTVSAGQKDVRSKMHLLSERVSQAELHRRFISALGDRLEKHTDIERKPLEIDLMPPLPSRARVYLFNATRPPGGRPTGEHKVQLTLPGQKRGERSKFDHSDGRIVLLVGYAAEEDVFILWDAGLYPDFAWSRNVQVKAQTIIQATAGRIACQARRLRPSNGEALIEVLVACPSPLLAEAIQQRQDLTRKRLSGADHETE